MSNTIRQIAGSIGTALLVTVMTTRTTIHLADYSNIVSEANPIVTEQLQQLGKGLAVMAGVPSQVGQSLAIQMIFGTASQQSAIKGIDDAFIVATWMAIIGLVLSFFIRRATPKEQ